MGVFVVKLRTNNAKGHTEFLVHESWCSTVDEFCETLSRQGRVSGKRLWTTHTGGDRMRIDRKTVCTVYERGVATVEESTYTYE